MSSKESESTGETIAAAAGTPPATDATESSRKGINIRQALDILSARTSHDHSHSHSDAQAGCQQNATDESKAMGQTIDLNAPERATPDPETIAKSMEEERKKLDRDRKTREEQIRAHLQTMSVKDLLQAVIEAQRERVATYRTYDGGLDTVLQNGNMTEYPTICARATASFSVLSDTVNTISSILKDAHKRPELLKLLSQLQKDEREKLNLTAALHLERIRQRNLEQAGEGDERVAQLLQDGATSLTSKLATCIDSINETLEEIRYAVGDED
jgi:hypothetical protein